jgi:glycosyltransferase involved in cell wall biosynthesis
MDGGLSPRLPVAGTGEGKASVTVMLVVSTVPTTANHFLSPFARRFRAAGWRVEVATRGDPDAAALDDSFDAVHRLPWARSLANSGNVRAVRAMRRLLVHGRYDLVHVHTPVAAMVTRLAAASLGRRRPPLVYTAHGFHFHSNGSRLANLGFASAERLAGRWTDRLVVINREDEQEALRRRIVAPGRLASVPGIGIDLEEYAPTAALLAQARRVRAEWNVPTGEKAYLMVAELRPVKNHATAVRALARLPHDRSHLFLAGAGPMRGEITRIAEESGVRDRVHFLGFVPEIRPQILAADATVLTSYREGLSRAVLESLALGVPVVGADSRGIRDLLDERVGVLVPPADVDAVADGLLRVRCLPTGGALRERTAQRLAPYSLANVIASHERLYGEVIGETGLPGVTGPRDVPHR